MRGEEPHHTRDDPVIQNTEDLKEETLLNNIQFYGVRAVPKG